VLYLSCPPNYKHYIHVYSVGLICMTLYTLCFKKRHPFYNSNNSVNPKWIWIIFGRNTARGIYTLLLCTFTYYFIVQLGISLCCYGNWFEEAPSPGTHGGTAAAVLTPLRHGEPALCGSHPLVTPYYCRLGDLLCFVFICHAYCMFDLSVYYLFLQYFDTVGWVFWPAKTVSHITYTVLVGT